MFVTYIYIALRNVPFLSKPESYVITRAARIIIYKTHIYTYVCRRVIMHYVYIYNVVTNKKKNEHRAVTGLLWL